MKTTTLSWIDRIVIFVSFVGLWIWVAVFSSMMAGLNERLHNQERAHRVLSEGIAARWATTNVIGRTNVVDTYVWPEGPGESGIVSYVTPSNGPVTLPNFPVRTNATTAHPPLWWQVLSNEMRAMNIQVQEYKVEQYRRILENP